MNRSAYIIPLFAALAVLTLVTGGCRTNPEISMETLLREMTDRQSATLLPDPAYSLKQFSSYDRASVAPGEEGWFANSDYSRFYGIDSSMAGVNSYCSTTAPRAPSFRCRNSWKQ